MSVREPELQAFVVLVMEDPPPPDIASTKGFGIKGDLHIAALLADEERQTCWCCGAGVGFITEGWTVTALVKQANSATVNLQCEICCPVVVTAPVQELLSP